MISPPLAERFLAELRNGKLISGFTPEATTALQRYRWPGNIRELRNVIERALFLCQTDRIGIEHLPAEFAGGKPAPAGVGDSISLDKLEETHIRRVLAKAKSLEEAAKILDIDVATLWRKRRKYGL